MQIVSSGHESSVLYKYFLNTVVVVVVVVVVAAAAESMHTFLVRNFPN